MCRYYTKKVSLNPKSLNFTNVKIKEFAKSIRKEETEKHLGDNLYSHSEYKIENTSHHAFS